MVRSPLDSYTDYKESGFEFITPYIIFKWRNEYYFSQLYPELIKVNPELDPGQASRRVNYAP